MLPLQNIYFKTEIGKMENRIKQRIIESGMTQKDLAEKLEITTVGLSQIVNATMPKIETYEKVANALGVPVWALLLSDKELEDIRSASTADRPADQFKCPVCGASLKVIPTDEK